MMRSRVEGLALAAGASGLALTIPSFLPPLVNSLVLGLSVGMIITGPLGELVNSATTPGPKKVPPEVKAMETIQKRRSVVEMEYARALDDFDSVIARLEGSHGGEVRDDVARSFNRSVGRLTDHYPMWNSEGRLRTYVLLKKIASSMDTSNMDEYLDLAYKTLVARGDEATQLSHITLNGSVERIYREPSSEGTHRLAGTLLLMNRGDELYAESMVVDALHLWSDARFARLEKDFATVSILGPEKVDSVVDLLDREVAKGKRAGEVTVVERAQRLKTTVLAATKTPAH